jgi:hypothetical protein
LKQNNCGQSTIAGKANASGDVYLGRYCAPFGAPPASRDGNELWISVKGYPEKSHHVQARHWFSGALFDLILYHGENPKARLGIALPDDFTTYENLVPRIKWLKESMPFQIYWVNESGSVRVE